MDVEEVQVEGELKVWLFMLFSPYFLCYIPAAEILQQI